MILVTFAKEEGLELIDEQLEAVSGGNCWQQPGLICPRCGKETCRQLDHNGNRYTTGLCDSCDYKWEIKRRSFGLSLRKRAEKYGGFHFGTFFIGGIC